MKPITIPQPYKAGGSVDVEQWAEMSPIQRAEALLLDMREFALRWANVQWRPAMGVPATVVADSQTLLARCNEALAAIRNEDASAILLAMQASTQAAELNRWAAIGAALELNKSLVKPKADGGRAAAARRKAEAAAQIAKAADLWANTYATRPERERAALIAARMGISARRAREYIKKAALR